jgi:hypothetical protein
MNAYKLNANAGHYFRKAICDGLKIPWTMIYKEVIDINEKGHILTKNGKVYKLTLTEVIDDTQGPKTS